jgi:anthranilate phosphoribosyltransferase
MIKEAIAILVEKENLTRLEMIEVMEEIMSGNTTPAQIASFLTALRFKGETIDEITGAAEVMRKKAASLKVSGKNFLVDTCGTGGDGMNTFNISTVSAFVAAGAGIKIAKHGNRSVSSKCGSADIMEALGVNINLTPLKVSMCIEKIGIGFLFAPLFHKAMKYASLPRMEIGIRTIFNILGPLTNPACASAQIIGVYDGYLTETLAYVLKNLGTKEAMVVNGHPGMDEITITEIALSILNGKKGPEREVVEINAAAAILVGGGIDDLNEGIMLARDSIDHGNAKKKLNDLITLSKDLALKSDN